MNETPRAIRPHIALFGRTNTGKSSVINALTNQDLALVSEVKGTTTDPVNEVKVERGMGRGDRRPRRDDRR